MIPNDFQKRKLRHTVGTVQRLQDALGIERDRRNKAMEQRAEMNQRLLIAQGDMAEIRHGYQPDTEIVQKQERHIAAIAEELAVIEAELQEIDQRIAGIHSDLGQAQPVAEALISRLDRDDPIRGLFDGVRQSPGNVIARRI